MTLIHNSRWSSTLLCFNFFLTNSIKHHGTASFRRDCVPFLFKCINTEESGKTELPLELWCRRGSHSICVLNRKKRKILKGTCILSKWRIHISEISLHRCHIKKPKSPILLLFLISLSTDEPALYLSLWDTTGLSCVPLTVCIKATLLPLILISYWPF